jgi:hypothetical protein
VNIHDKRKDCRMEEEIGDFPSIIPYTTGIIKNARRRMWRCTVQTGSGVHQTYPVGTRNCFPGGKGAGV